MSSVDCQCWVSGTESFYRCTLSFQQDLKAIICSLPICQHPYLNLVQNLECLKCLRYFSVGHCLPHLELSEQRKQMKMKIQILTEPIYFLMILEKTLFIGYATDKFCKLSPLVSPQRNFKYLHRAGLSGFQTHHSSSHPSHAPIGECDQGLQSGSCNKTLIKIELNCFKIHCLTIRF